MPDFASANRVALRYVEETTWGETPASPTLQALRFNDESLNYAANFTQSEELRSDRMTSDIIQVSAQGEGDINAEMSYGTYDDLIRGAMFHGAAWYTTGDPVTATDISITKTSGTPNTWSIGTVAEDFTTQNWAVGQMLKVAGFSTAGTFYAEIVSIAATALVVKPLADVATEAAGDSVTITALNHVRNGTTLASFTIQKAFLDLSTPEMFNFTGAVIGSWDLELATGSILSTSFGILAETASMTESQFSGASITAANTNQVLNAVDNVAAIAFDGDPGGNTYYFNSLSISLDNTLRGQEAIGTLGLIGIRPGRLNITGDIELYLENSALFDKFRAGTAFQLVFRVADAAGQGYIINLPNCKFESADVTAGGSDQDVMMSGTFRALANAAGTYQIQVSKFS